MSRTLLIALILVSLSLRSQHRESEYYHVLEAAAEQGIEEARVKYREIEKDIEDSVRLLNLSYAFGQILIDNFESRESNSRFRFFPNVFVEAGSTYIH